MKLLKVTPLDCSLWIQNGDGQATFSRRFFQYSNMRRRLKLHSIHCVLDTLYTEYRYNFNFQFISELTINAKQWNMPNNWTLPKTGDQTVLIKNFEKEWNALIQQRCYRESIYCQSTDTERHMWDNINCAISAEWRTQKLWFKFYKYYE